MKPTNPVSPAEVLREEFLSQGVVAVLDGGPVTEDRAADLARLTGTTPEFWLNLQSLYDERVSREES